MVWGLGLCCVVLCCVVSLSLCVCSTTNPHDHFRLLGTWQELAQTQPVACPASGLGDKRRRIRSDRGPRVERPGGELPHVRGSGRANPPGALRLRHHLQGAAHALGFRRATHWWCCPLLPQRGNPRPIEGRVQEDQVAQKQDPGDQPELVRS